MNFILFVLVLAVVTFLGLTAVTYFAQTAILFPTSLAAGAGPGRLPSGAQRIEARAESGERLSGIRIPGDPAQPLILGFGGNAWNAEAMALVLHDLLPGREIVAFHYRGYAPSEGSPSAAAILADALPVFEAAGGSSRRVVTVGFSIGATVAAHIGAQRPLVGVILVTPFDTLEGLAREHYPWAPVGLLIRHRMSTVDDVRSTDAPVAMITASDDRIVPPRRSAALRPAIRRLVYDRTLEAGHNDLYGHPDFARTKREALAAVEAVH